MSNPESDDCFFCMRLRPDTRFIAIKDVPLPKEVIISADLRDSEFVICKECDEMPFEWKEARMITALDHTQTFAELLQRHPWPFTAARLPNEMWTVLDGTGGRVTYMGQEVEHEDQKVADDLIDCLRQWTERRGEDNDKA